MAIVNDSDREWASARLRELLAKFAELNAEFKTLAEEVFEYEQSRTELSGTLLQAPHDPASGD